MNDNPSSLYTYKLTIAYDGRNYCGWQVQPNALSIQSLVENAVKIFTKEAVQVIGAGRTDAGVHAKGQVAHCRTHTPQNTFHFKRALNGILPLSIRVLDVEEVSSSFHAQKSARSKEYHYHIGLGDVVLPFYQPYVWHIRYPIDIELLTESSHLFVGRHNFTAFANAQDGGRASRNPVRTIYRLDCVPTESGVRLEVEGDGFLYKMVRNITGMLVAVASHKKKQNDITMLLLGAPRQAAAQAAPPGGLFLMKVNYE